MYVRYGNNWSNWHGEINGDIKSVELSPGAMIKGVEGASIDTTSFYMLNFTMSDGSQEVLGINIYYKQYQKHLKSSLDNKIHTELEIKTILERANSTKRLPDKTGQPGQNTTVEIHKLLLRT